MIERYDQIGKDYNHTRKADAYLAERLFHHLSPKNSCKYLDIGCGTGNYTIALNQKGVDFVGVDPSNEMLQQAMAKSNKIDWKFAKAENIPLENETVDGIIATLTTHHWTNFEKAFLELNRVLKPKGRMVIFTSNPNQMRGYWLNHYFPKMLEISMDQMPTFEFTRNALEKCGFEIIKTEKYFVRKDLEDLFLYSGKHNPALYLNPQVRQGISSFSDLANKEEVEEGLKTLHQDIESGKISEIIRDYENDRGDYLFIISEKLNRKVKGKR